VVNNPPHCPPYIGATEKAIGEITSPDDDEAKVALSAMRPLVFIAIHV